MVNRCCVEGQHGKNVAHPSQACLFHMSTWIASLILT
jgi:hypothetical protein